MRMDGRKMRLGELCRFQNGSAFSPSDWSDSGLPIIRIQNLNNRARSFNYWPGSLEDKVVVDAGDVLLGWSGTPGTSFGAHVWCGDRGVLNQHIFKVTFDEGLVDRDWLVFLINHRLAELVAAAHGGVGLRHVKKSEITSLEFRLPSLADQRRIAQRLIDGIDQVNAARTGANARALAGERLTAAILSEAFLLPKPSNWLRAELGKLIRRYNIVVHPGDREHGIARFVGLEHIESHTGRRLGESVIDFSAMTGRKPSFLANHIVYGYLRPYLNKVWIAEFDGCCSVDQYCFEVVHQYDIEFVAMFMRSPVFLRRAQVVTTTGQLPRIGVDEIMKVPVEIPPTVLEQRRFVGEVKKRLAEASTIVDRLRADADVLKDLPSLLLREAFDG
jgi:type I restriction enzyme S subunit